MILLKMEKLENTLIKQFRRSQRGFLFGLHFSLQNYFSILQLCQLYQFMANQMVILLSSQYASLLIKLYYHLVVEITLSDYGDYIGQQQAKLNVHNSQLAKLLKKLRQKRKFNLKIIVLKIRCHKQNSTFIRHYLQSIYFLIIYTLRIYLFSLFPKEKYLSMRSINLERRIFQSLRSRFKIIFQIQRKLILRIAKLKGVNYQNINDQNILII
ncbi:unnamed protein product [Paramecium pentaurelia]|uniref:Uncharacterized protein n=1 Tax=Paramecium pentaurelia TaxID=43138 RepID=A0A8S1YQA3_9CILI|nr:unnamed protein product [Paramecium pentaurelia]